MSNINTRSPISFDESLRTHRSIYFEVPGNPFAKQRPRAARTGKFITVYTPPETKKYEEKVRNYFRRTYSRDTILNGDLTVDIEGIFSIPKSVSKINHSKMLSGEIPHTSKPDCDNMGKICLDALNGTAYNDDAAINKLNISKRYGENPMVRIRITENQETKQGEG